MYIKPIYYIICFLITNILLLYWIVYFIYAIHGIIFFLAIMCRVTFWPEFEGVEDLYDEILGVNLFLLYHLWLTLCNYIYNEDISDINNRQLLLNPDRNFMEKHPYFISFNLFIIIILIFMYLIYLYRLINLFKLENLTFILIKFTAKYFKYLFKFYLWMLFFYNLITIKMFLAWPRT